MIVQKPLSRVLGVMTLLGLALGLIGPGAVSVQAAPLAASPGDVLINEFTAKGTEWVELFNPTGSTINITDWILSDKEDDEVLSGNIDPGSYLVIITSLALSNDGDEIQLFDDESSLIDEVVYGIKGGAPLPPYSTSTARCPNGLDTDDFARDWNVDQSPSEGEENECPGTALGSSIILNEQNAYSPGSDFYELYNPTDHEVDLSGWQASDGDDIEDISGEIQAGDYLVFANLSISKDDVLYLWDDTGVRIDQLGRYGEYEDGSLQRIPDGEGPNDGYDFWSSEGGFTYFDCEPTPGEENGKFGCDDDIPLDLTIPEIQGDGFRSPYEEELVRTSGVVTLITSDSRSFWIQDPEGDDNADTSDGIYVYRGADFAPVKVGDEITLIAKVKEYAFGNDQPLTELSYTSFLKVVSTDNTLPTPQEISNLPDVSILDALDYWESLEGMLVSVRNAPVVSATTRYGEFAVLAKDDAKPGSGFFPQTQQILLQSQNSNEVDYNPERIVVDDLTLEDAIDVMPGDRVRHLIGVVDYNYGMYKIQPADYEVKTHNLPNLPTSTRSGPNGDTVITTFNVENLFDLIVEGHVDIIGQIGVDPGSEWGSGLISTGNNTIRRLPSVCQGDPNGSDPFDPTLEWEGFAQDTFDGLGAHTGSCGEASDLFISEYIEGSSYNKAIEIFNGTGDPVDLAAGGYKLEMYFNGKDYPTTVVSLTGVIAPGNVFVIADDGADAAILAVADQTSTASFFNGDDAVVLSKGGKDDAGSTPTAEELEVQLSKLALAISVEIELPEILVVQEVENETILQELGDRVNAANGTDYVATSFETSDVRGIEAGFLWDRNRVSLETAYQMSGPAVEAAFGPFSPSAGREPIVGVFDIDGTTITIIGNHFKSKGGDDPLFGFIQPPIRITEIQRKMQAQAVRDFVDGLFTADPDALVMVTGDLNDFEFGEPGEGPDHPVAILEGFGDETPLINLINLEKDAERFTYTYDGNSQVLDHMLVSPALYDLFVAVDILHFNASFPSILGEDASTPLRCSDHDAVEGRFAFQ